MNTYIALLRGIGGKHTLPMKGLVELLEGMALSKVRTYIQSGNAIFQSERIGARAFCQNPGRDRSSVGICSTCNRLDAG